LILPPAVVASITSDPESEEEVKNMMNRTTPMNEVMADSGSWPSMADSCSSSGASRTPVELALSSRSKAVPPKAVIHNTDTSEGTRVTAIGNSRTVRPRLTRAMNMPTKGDQLIHQAQ